MLTKIISGGQTGVDRIALEVAKELGYETGGTAPDNYYTENGRDLTLKEFGLVAFGSYRTRTDQNVKDADATLLFEVVSSVGSTLTQRCAIKHYKPLYVNPSVIAIKSLKERYNIINIAGNRGSKLNAEQKQTIRNTLLEGLK